MAENNRRIAQLQREFCPPLDIATLLAILSDYNLDDSEQLKTAWESLNILTETVEIEEASGFDPSGSSGRDGNGNPRAEVDSESGQSHPGWSSYTDDTSLSQGMSALDLEGLEISDAHNGADDEGDGKEITAALIRNARLEGLDLASKEAVLLETFPGLKPFDVKWTLNKCKGDCGLATDELLNQVFLEDSGHRLKGIEAFSESSEPQPSRRAKSRKKRKSIYDGSNAPEVEMASPGATENKWDMARKDVEFISSRTGMPFQQITSMYHKNGGSVHATIYAIIEAHMALRIEPEDARVKISAQELSEEFPAIKPSHLLALTQLTYPSTSSAHELAKALIAQPKSTSKGVPIQIEFRVPPPDLFDATSKPKPRAHNAVFASDDPAPPLSIYKPTGNSEDYLSLRNEAFDRASAAYRRGKSDHLMSGAAAYYSSLGRSYDAAAKTAQASAADALAASQSTNTTLDLHGINVKDAVRIARESVTAWWAKKGNAPYHAGYRIVTGKGMHSEGGKGKLGPAIGRMLIQEGWKVEVGSGVLIVTGVVG